MSQIGCAEWTHRAAALADRIVDALWRKKLPYDPTGLLIESDKSVFELNLPKYEFRSFLRVLMQMPISGPES